MKTQTAFERAQAIAAGLELEQDDAVPSPGPPTPVIEQMLTAPAPRRVKGRSKPLAPPPPLPDVTVPPPVEGSVPLPPTGEINLFEKAICLSVALNRWGTTRKVRSSAVVSATVANPDFIYTTKKILRCPEHKAITSLDGEIRAFLRSRTLPSRLYRSGVYLVPVELTGEVDDRLQEYMVKRQGLVDALMGVLKERIAEAAVALKLLFEEGDYPAAEMIKSEFSMTMEYLTYGVPRALERVRADIMKRETEKATKKIQDDISLITNAMREGFKGMINHAVDRLTPDDDGKAKKFHYTMVEKLDDFLRTFRARNIVQDGALNALVDQARGLLKGVDPESIRKNADVRDMLKTGFTAINEKLDGMVVKTGRQFTNDDDDVDADDAEAA